MIALAVWQFVLILLGAIVLGGVLMVLVIALIAKASSDHGTY